MLGRMAAFDRKTIRFPTHPSPNFNARPEGIVVDTVVLHATVLDTLQEVVDKMKQGDITNPIRMQKGYQVFKLETLKTAVLQPFESVSDLISEKVSAARTQTEMRKFLARLRAQAVIEWKNDELKKAYERALAIEPNPSGQ